MGICGGKGGVGYAQSRKDSSVERRCVPGCTWKAPCSAATSLCVSICTFGTSKASKLSTSSRVDEADLQLCDAAIDDG